MWISAPREVVDILERWALVRSQHMEPLYNDPRPLREDDADLGVQPGTGENRETVQLEAFPVLNKALTYAIAEWWAANQHNPQTQLCLASRRDEDCRQQRVSTLDVRDMLRKILGVETRTALVGSTRHAGTHLVWSSGSVRLLFASGRRIEVTERVGPQGTRDSIRERPEVVGEIEVVGDHYIATVHYGDGRPWGPAIRLPPQL